MGSIAGPIIRFRFDAPSAKQAAGQITRTLQSQFKSAGKQAAADFVDPLIAKAAKLRAQIAAGLKPEAEVLNVRKRLISSLETEIQLRTRKLKYTQDDLATLKKYTMELERQKSFLAGTGGITKGTEAAASRFATILKQSISGISARLGSYGGGFGSFAGLRISEPLGKFAEEAAPAHLALLGIGTAAVAAGVALGAMTKKGADFAIEMQRLAEKSGVSVNSIVQLRSVSKALDVDFDSVTRGFKKFSTEITYAMGASLPHASYEAVRAGKIFEALGVNIQQAAADPMTAMEQLTKTLGQLPDGAVKTAVAVQLFGRAGQELLPVMDHFKEAMEGTKQSSQDLARALGTDVTHSVDALKIQMVNWGNETKALEVVLAQKLIPAIVSAISWFNRLVDAISHPTNNATDVTSSIQGILRARGKQLSPFGQEELKKFLTPQTQYIPGAFGGTTVQVPRIESNEAVANPQKAIDLFTQYIAKTEGAAAANNLFAASTDKAASSIRKLNALEKTLAPLLSMDSAGRGGRGGPDFSQPLFIDKAASEWEKYERGVVKAYEAHQKLLEAMRKSNAELFQENAILTDLNGPIGMAIGSPDKTGAGIQKFFDAMNKANTKTAKKAAEEWQRQFDKLKESVGNLFDAMLQGAHSFGEALKRMVETALLAPVKEAFSTQIAKLIQSIEKSVQDSVKKNGGKGSKGIGGFFAKILAALGLGGTPASQQNIAQSNVNAMTVGTLTILGGGTNIPKPGGNSFADFFGGGGTSSFSSLSGLGGMSLALASSGGMAVAGSGGSNVAAPGGTVNSGGIPGTASQAAGLLKGISGNRAVQAIAPLVPGLALLGTGIATRNGAAEALGIGATAGAGLTELSNLKALQGTPIGKPLSALGGKSVLGALGAAAPGIGMMFAGNQTGGFGGAAEGALGGAMAGFQLGGPIGGAIGAVAGAIMGAFGKKNNQQAWNNAVTKAANNQRITQPMTENFAFAAMNTIGKTFSTTFGQGPGGFSNSTLAANTPFWANAILGTPRGTNNQIAWNALLNGVNPNSPFFGGTNNPFTGGPLPNGLRLPGAPTGAFSPNAGYGTPSGSSNVSVHFTVPGYVDKAGLADIVKTAAPLIHQSVARSVYQQSSGFRRAASKAINLP